MNRKPQRRQIMNSEYEFIVVGTGPGGAPVALELAKAGKKVLMIERGAYHKRFLGLPFGARLAERFFMFNRSIEGVIMERGITVGGSSMIYQGNVFDTSEAFIKKMGVDYRPEAKEIKEEIGVKTLPDRFFGRNGSTGLQKMLEVAEKMGTPFEPQKKFIDPDKCKETCDFCMLGCPRGAKWTTRSYVDEAVEKYGALLMVSSKADQLLFNDKKNKVIGVKLTNGKQIMGDNVILSAGAIGSAGIFIRSGIDKAGKRFFMDPMNILYGMSEQENGGAYGDPTFSYAIESYADKEGFMIGNNNSLSTWMVMSSFRPKVALSNFYKLPMYKRGIGLFVKMAEDDKGEIFSNERTSKPMTENDIIRMKRATDAAKEIMIKAGAKPSSISVLESSGGHPGGAVEIEKFVDRNFKSKDFDNLYVCDASIFPVSPGSPPSLGIMGMSRLLSKFILGNVKPEDRYVS